MTQVELVENVNLGIIDSVKNYYNLSGGDFIGDMAGECFIVSSIINRIIKIIKKDKNVYYLKVEYPFSKMMENDYHTVGCPPSILMGAGRIDIALINYLYQLKYAIEVKIGRQFVKEDIMRLRTLYNKFNHNKYNSSMICGISALLVFFKGNNKEIALNGLNCNLDGWINFYKEIDVGKGILEFIKCKNHIFIDTNEDKVIAAKSLCAIVK